MLHKLIPAIAIPSFLYSLINGTLPALSAAVFGACERAVTLTLLLLGSMCFWSGLMEVWKSAGVIGFVSKLLSPFLRWVFPESSKDPETREAIAAALAANMLGIGNAATPLATGAMKAMQKQNGTKERASDDMVTFTVLGCAPLSLLPTTVLALRAAGGSHNAASVLIPIILCSLAGSLFSVILSRLICRLKRS